MIVTLDGRRLPDTFATEATLQNVIDQVRDTHLKDRLVISVAVDGRVLGDDELTANMECQMPDAAQVELQSSTPSELATAALRGLAAEFADADVRLADIAERLNSADVATAIRDVGVFVSLWQTCNRALSQCSALLNTDLLGAEYEGQPARARLTELVDKLTAVRNALEASDVVLLADLVRYELPPLAQTWQAILNRLADHAAVVESPA